MFSPLDILRLPPFLLKNQDIQPTSLPQKGWHPVWFAHNDGSPVRAGCPL